MITACMGRRQPVQPKKRMFFWGDGGSKARMQTGYKNIAHMALKRHAGVKQNYSLKPHPR